jgi:type II secretory pathway pseudopilin PulG
MNWSAAPKRKVAGSTAFTLIELLTVIGILAMLAGILLPVLASARRAGQSSMCLSNLRSSGQALSMYGSDHDDQLPTGTVSPKYSSYAFTEQIIHDQYCQCEPRCDDPVYCWLNAVHSYLTLSELHCPGDHLIPPYRGSSSYEYKLQFAYDGYTDGIEKPSKVALVWEKWSFHLPALYSEFDSRASLNVLFLDLSAKYKRLSRASSTVFGDGPDLHYVFPGVPPDFKYAGEDFID